jgi:putative redox protein
MTSLKYPIVFDYVPPLGSGGGFAGIEMLTMSFAGCVSTAILGLMKRRGKKIDSYEMNIKGVKCEEPLSLQSIDFIASIAADDVSDQDIAEVMEMAEKILP